MTDTSAPLTDSKESPMASPRPRNNTPLRELEECGTACFGLDTVQRDFNVLKKEQQDVRAEIKADQLERKEAQSRMLKWILGAMTGILLPAAMAVGSTLIGIGEIREQQRAMREDVSTLLGVSRRLDHDNTVSDAAIQESARDREALHTYDHNLELKIWELQTRSSGVQMPTPLTPRVPTTVEPSPP